MERAFRLACSRVRRVKISQPERGRLLESRPAQLLPAVSDQPRQGLKRACEGGLKPWNNSALLPVSRGAPWTPLLERPTGLLKPNPRFPSRRLDQRMDSDGYTFSNSHNSLELPSHLQETQEAPTQSKTSTSSAPVFFIVQQPNVGRVGVAVQSVLRLVSSSEGDRCCHAVVVLQLVSGITDVQPQASAPPSCPRPASACRQVRQQNKSTA